MLRVPTTSSFAPLVDQSHREQSIGQDVDPDLLIDPRQSEFQALARSGSTEQVVTQKSGVVPAVRPATLA